MATLVVVGVLVGLVGGYALSFGISIWLSKQTGIALSPSLGLTEALVGAVILVTGLVLAVLPASRLQRRPLAALMTNH
jgi:putative ABC transport system permease protein